MSCFESSTFLKNPSVMNQEVLQKVCDKLKWRYEVRVENGNQVLLVYDVNQKTNLKGEFALKVVGNQITYNSYYLKNGKELAKELENTFYGMNVEYAYETILREFQAVGFKLLPDYKFKETDKEKMRFKMVAHSTMPNESEKRTEIEFTILYDGTVVTDSNYIPEDVHKLADKAMESLDQAFGTKRKEGEQIKRKEIPLKYKDKAYCKAGSKIVAKY